MGIFGSKFKTTVATTVSRVVDDDHLPESIKRGFVESMQNEDGQLIENALDTLANGIGVKANVMYNYAKDHYAYGLPSATVYHNDASQAIKAAIEDYEGGVVQMDYAHFGPLNNQHYGWSVLVSNYGYNEALNRLGTLSTEKNTPVYLKNMIVMVTEATYEELNNGSLDQWGMTPVAGPTPQRPRQTMSIGELRKQPMFEVSSTIPNDQLKVLFVWEVDSFYYAEGVQIPSKVIMEDSFTIPVTGIDQEADYFQAKYYKNGQVKYITIKRGDGSFPSLDLLFDGDYDDLGSFFPFGYFRYNKTSMMDMNKQSPEFKTSKKMMKYLGIDLETVTEKIHENPDIEQVEQAMLFMAVPATTTDPLEQRYIFDFFNRLYIEEGGGKSKSASVLDESLGVAPTETAIVIQDKRFKMALSYRRINRKKVKGNIGKKGTYSSGSGSEMFTKTGLADGGTLTTIFERSVPTHMYRHQISETMYEEIEVLGLTMTYYIFEQYTTTGDDTDNILLIPIDRSITKDYSVPDREILYTRSLHFVFNSRVLTKIQWYQTGIFKIFMLIIAIIVIVVTWGAATPAVAAAYAAGGVLAAAYVIAIMVIKYVVVSMVIKLLVRKAGAKVAIIAAIIAAAYGYNTDPSAATSLATEASAVAGAPWSTQLLSLASNISVILTEQTKLDMEGLRNEATDFSLFVEKQTKLLDKAEDLLDSNNLMTPTIIFGETPDQFYERTVHYGNIGILGIDAVQSYVDNALTLPKLSETIEEKSV